MQEHISLIPHMSLHIMVVRRMERRKSSLLRTFSRSSYDRAFAQEHADESGTPTAAKRPKVGHSGG
jgi:hypothetical protein